MVPSGIILGASFILGAVCILWWDINFGCIFMFLASVFIWPSCYFGTMTAA